METFALSRFALTVSAAAALLAACGGSQPPIGTPGAMPQAPAIIAPARTIVSSKGNSSSSYEVLHSFGGSGDGSVPLAGLIKVKGTLYGTTAAGGASGDGTVFSITPSGTETVLHSFGGSGDGTQPYAGLINVKGTLYGTTYQGGGGSNGTVFSITPSGTERVLHSFGGTTNDGVFPYAGLLNVKGTLYGTTYYGGTNSYGTVFSITPSGTETVLYSFAGYNHGDGLEPEGDLINVKGTLYGTTSGAGANCCGTVFSITPSGTETVLHSFGGSADGDTRMRASSTSTARFTAQPKRAARLGYGTVFKITRARQGNRAPQLRRFGSRRKPVRGLLNVNGTLYGTSGRGWRARPRHSLQDHQGATRKRCCTASAVRGMAHTRTRA